MQYNDLTTSVSYAMKYSNKYVKNNKQYVLKMLALDVECYQYISAELKKDKQLALIACKNEYMFRHVPSELQNDKAFVLQVLQVNAEIYLYLTEQFKQDKDIVMQTLQTDGTKYKYLDKQFNKGTELALIAIKTDHKMIDCIDQSLLNEDYVLRAVRINGLVIGCLDNKFKTNKRIIMEACQQNIQALQYVKSLIKNDTDLWLELFKIDNYVVAQYLPDTDNINYTYLASQMVQINGLCLEQFTKLHTNTHIVLEAVKQNASAFQFAKAGAYSDRNIILTALRGNGDTLMWMNNTITLDKEMVMTAVKSCGGALEYLDEPYINDKEVVLAAINNHPVAYEYVNPSLKTDADVLKAYNNWNH